MGEGRNRCRNSIKKKKDGRWKKGRETKVMKGKKGKEDGDRKGKEICVDGEKDRNERYTNRVTGRGEGEMH